MQIVSNGIYKSILHRVKVSSESSKISVVSFIGTSLESVVAPLPQLVDGADRPAAFRAVTYKEYIELQKTQMLLGKSYLDHLRL
ncbi:Codeine O-demethylase [Platanthera zijinensis]|uniref:Codeine O-demethylase n=1 Tax=Platanthera zijinensis TaxID=2320716 RepID=A0AAP0BI62_9ASPA